MKFFLIKALLPIIFTSITGTSMLLLTNCSKNSAGGYNYGSNEKSYDIHGTN
jgi:hypothetical protein